MTGQSNVVIQDEERMLVRIAWACEIEGLTQAEAARQFGITRLRVNRALAEARRRGIVQVSINSSYEPCAKAEAQLIKKFSLLDAHVAPAAKNNSNEHALIGQYLGHYLNKVLADPSIKLFGMSWGETLNSAMQSMKPLNRPDLQILSVMGCAIRASRLNIIESTRLLANLCNAEQSYFTAPLYAGSAKSRATLLEQDVFKDMVDRICTVDALAMTLGDTSNRSHMVRDGLPEWVTINELIEHGAVGDALGYYLGPNGKPIRHPLNRCVLGMELDDLANIPNVILAAGGNHKLPVLRAFLKRNVVNTLVTDQATARALLKEDISASG